MIMKTMFEEINRIKSMMGIISEDHGRVMSIIDLAEFASRLGEDVDTILILLSRAYRHSGDDGVMGIFGEMTGHAIVSVSRGHYMMAS